MDFVRPSLFVRSLTLAFTLCSAIEALAAPAILNYQAKLTDSNNVPLNTVANVTFTFWDSATTGTQLGNGFSDTDSVSVVNGVCSTDIGDDPSNPIPLSVFSSSSVWLNVNVNGSDLVPRNRVAGSAYALNALSIFGYAYEIVEVTDNAITNGTNLLAAYERAKSLKPHGQIRSDTNRAVLLVPPGNYDLGKGELFLDGDSLDLVGMSSTPDDQHIYGSANGPGTGVLGQGSNFLHIENLFVECTTHTGSLSYTSNDPAAYFPESNINGTVVRNCKFKADDSHAWGMRLGIEYSGTYIDCSSGDGAFGAFGIASGTFTNCTGITVAFGGKGTASGTFTNCSGNTYSFGGSGSGGGVASGTFTNCVGGGGAFAGGNANSISGTFYHCVALGGAFGDGGTGINAKFYHCTTGPNSFPSGGTFTAVACVLNGAPYPPSSALELLGPSYTIVQVTNNAVTNGSNLLSAYTRTKTLHPNGQDLSTTNRGTLMVPPGSYNLGSSQLTLDTNYVDVVGLSSQRRDQYIFGTAGPSDAGVVGQPASDVRIENLYVECTRNTGSLSGFSTDPAAYYPGSNLPATVVRNCEFKADETHAWSMRVAMIYSGTYTDCVAGKSSYGGNSGTASGTFTNCSGGDFSFAGVGGLASGNFVRCSGLTSAFGGGNGSASGVFINCVGGDSSFAGSTGNGTGAKFSYCNGGPNSFTTAGSPLVLYCIRNGAAYP